MRYLQYLIVELSPECDLAQEHPLCPVQDSLRWRYVDTRRRLDDDTIISLAIRAYQEMGFRGLTGFHFYNEPLLEKERMLGIIQRIRAKVPQSRFTLWTNGTFIQPPAAELSVFEEVVVSNYHDRNLSFLQNVVPRLYIGHPKLDNRRDLKPEYGRTPCFRPFVELIIDCFGNAHLCSTDWAGKVSTGNVFTSDFAQIVTRHEEIRDRMCGEEMSADAPAHCRHCSHRYPQIDLHDPPIAEESKGVLQDAMIQARRKMRQAIMSPRQIGVVLTTYGIPGDRLRDHFVWNDAFYRGSQAVVFVVSDWEITDLPAYAKGIFYPDLAIGNHSWQACRLGIQLALDARCEIVIKTEADVCFEKSSWDKMIRVWPGEAIVPAYRVCQSYKTREKTSVADGSWLATMSMTAGNWIRIAADWQNDDPSECDSVQVLRQAGLIVDRSAFVYSVMDQSAQDRNPFKRDLLKKVAVVVPTHKAQLDPDEKISLEHLHRFLGSYDKFLVIPKGLKPDYSDGFTVKEFDPMHFADHKSHNFRFRMSKEFYEAFGEYRYILVHELDGLVLSDSLEAWCRKGYDYVGAPWPDGYFPWAEGDCVGNGGFSLRKVESCLRALERTNDFGIILLFVWRYLHLSGFQTKIKDLLKKYKFGEVWDAFKEIFENSSKLATCEDIFLGLQAKKWYKPFRVAPTSEALWFSFELEPRRYFEKTHKTLPFGCHGWTRHGTVFWEEVIGKFEMPEEKRTVFEGDLIA